MTFITELSRVLHPQLVLEVENLSNELERKKLFGFEMADGGEWLKNLLCSTRFSHSNINHEDVECRLRLLSASIEDKVITNQIFIKKPNPDDQPTEVQFNYRNYEHTFEIKDFWNYVVDGKTTIIIECTVFKSKIVQEISLESLCLQHQMRNLSKKNALDVLVIADLYGFKNLVDQCISVIQNHINELKHTPKFASLKLQLKDEILNRKKLILKTKVSTLKVMRMMYERMMIEVMLNYAKRLLDFLPL